MSSLSPTAQQKPQVGIEHKDAKLANLDLHFYYTRLFPMEKMVEWLAYERNQDAGKKALARREFSLSLPADDGGEIYMRWLCFANQESWMGKLIHSTPYPHKMDIGAIYSLPLTMKDLQPHKFHSLEKEVVFDIDMNDYDAVRNCCTGKTICTKCWRFMTLAMSILDGAFREDFGFKDILWVYSGRRGIHAWICDKAARKMSNPARVAMVAYLNVINERAQEGVGVKLFHRLPGNRLGRDEAGEVLAHPVLSRARHFCTKAWNDILAEQNIFGTQDDKAIESLAKLRQHLGIYAHLVETGQAHLAKSLGESDYSVRLWRFLEENAKRLPRLRNHLDEVAVGFTYPRLDVNVTKDMGHLLKAPFCAHPGTGRICVPIDPTQNGTDGRGVFNPKEVPTIPGLMAEFRQNGGRGTSLEPYLEYFQSVFLDRLGVNEAENDDMMEG